MLPLLTPLLIKAYLGSPEATLSTVRCLVTISALALVAKENHRRNPIRATLALYYVATFLATWLINFSLIKTQFVPGLYLVLTLMTAGSPLLGYGPFTRFFAQAKLSDPSAWERPGFILVVNQLAWFWGGLFLFAFISSELALGPRWLPAAVMAGIGLPITFLYPKWRRSKS